jgi:hypothetical protein
MTLQIPDYRNLELPYKHKHSKKEPVMGFVCPVTLQNYWEDFLKGKAVEV